MSETIHTKKLFDGRQTAEEVHRSLAFPADARCACGSKKVAIRVRVFWPADDLVREKPEFAMQMAARHGGRLPVVEFKHGKHVRVGDAFACDLCKSVLEKEAAKAPSWVVVEVDRGPGPDNAQVQVG